MYSARVLSGFEFTNEDVGVVIQLRLYQDNSVADLTLVTTATLLVQMNNLPQDVRRFPLTVNGDPTTGLVTYIVQAGDFAPAPGDPLMYPNVDARVQLEFPGGVVLDSKPFNLLIDAAWTT